PARAASTLDSQRAIGEVALRSKDPNDLRRAMSMAEAVVKAAPDDYRGHLLLGQAYAAGAGADLKLTDEERLNLAEEKFRKACDLARTEPATWLTLVQFFVATKRMNDARAAADSAQGALTGPKGLAALARINSQVGRAEKAAEL